MAHVRSIIILLFVLIVAVPSAKADAAVQCPVDIIEDPAAVVIACNQRLGEASLSADERSHAFVVRARALHALWRFDAAALDYEQAIALASDPTDGHTGRGWLAYDQHDYPLALVHARAVLKVKPESPQALDLVGSIKRAVLDFRGAREAFDKAIAIAPRNGRYRYHRFEMLEAFGHHREALEDADAIMRLPAKELDIPMRLFLWNKFLSVRVAIGIDRAALLDAMARPDDAAAAYDEIVARAPSALTYGMRADFRFTRQVPLDVIQGDIDKALALEPDYWLGHDQQAHMYWRRKQPEAALAEYTRAVTLWPYYGPLRWSRAMVLRELGRLDEATTEALAAVDDKNLLRRKIGTLTNLGYLGPVPADGDPMPVIRDAVRACMLDKRCS